MQSHLTTKPLPFFYVGKDVTADRIKRFQESKHALLSKAIGKPDTRSVWYTKEHFQKLLEEIDFAKGDGIRVHFGMYEPGHKYEGQTCLLFTTTREESVGGTILHSNVVLENEPDFPKRSSQPREVILFPGQSPEDDRDFNLGSPCPPSCDDSQPPFPPTNP